jgi:hypothetical protein
VKAESRTKDLQQPRERKQVSLPSIPRRTAVKVGLSVLTVIVILFLSSKLYMLLDGVQSTAPSGFSTTTIMEPYDDFGNTIFDGLYDRNKWGYFSNSGVTTGIQKNGSFEMAVEETNAISDVSFIVYPARRLTQTNALEAKLMVEQSKGQNFSILIKTAPALDYYWHYACWLLSNPNGVYAWCEVNDTQSGGESISYRGETIETVKGRFVPMKIEIDPQSLVIRSYIDGELMDIYDIPVKEDKKNAIFDFVISLWVDPGTSGVAQADDVFLGRPAPTTPTP